jgi:hypothetical protein
LSGIVPSYGGGFLIMHPARGADIDPAQSGARLTRPSGAA